MRLTYLNLNAYKDQIAASTSVTTVTAGDHIKVTPTVKW